MNGVGLYNDIYYTNRIGLHVENSPPTSSIRMKHSNVEKNRSFTLIFGKKIYKQDTPLFFLSILSIF